MSCNDCTRCTDVCTDNPELTLCVVRGDALGITFNIDGYELTPDTIVFESSVVCKTVDEGITIDETGENLVFTVSFTADDTNAMETGTYGFRVYLTQDDETYTMARGYLKIVREVPADE